MLTNLQSVYLFLNFGCDECVSMCVSRVGGVRNDAKQQFLLRVEPHAANRWPRGGFEQRPLPMQHIHYPQETRTRVIVMNRDSYWIYRLIMYLSQTHHIHFMRYMCGYSISDHSNFYEKRISQWIFVDVSIGRSRRGLQCLTAARVRDGAKVTNKLCDTNRWDPLQTFQTVKGHIQQY